jgi:hypothetical protein
VYKVGLGLQIKQLILKKIVEKSEENHDVLVPYSMKNVTVTLETGVTRRM